MEHIWHLPKSRSSSCAAWPPTQSAHPVGKNDLSENAVKQADETIEKRELIKCSVLDGSGLTAKEAGEGLAEQLGAELVQVIGNRFVLYRRSQRDDVEHIRLVRE